MADLKPCPFCGGEAAVTCLNKGQCQARVGCVGCGATINRYYRSKVDAAEAWNARWERTCRDALPEKHGEPIEGYWECSECGCEIGDDCDAPKYCPNCGAKVVAR